MKRNTKRGAVFLVLAATGLSAYAQQTSSRLTPVTAKVASPPTASSLAYPQSVFVDSQNGNIWVTDFDNNRVLRFDVSKLTSVAEPSGIAAPGGYMLGQNYPNPFNPITTIGFRVAGEKTGSTSIDNSPSTIDNRLGSGVWGLGSGWVRLSVYDLLGREVAVLVDEEKKAGNYSVTFDASGLASGMYFYALRSADRFEVKKMSCLK